MTINNCEVIEGYNRPISAELPTEDTVKFVKIKAAVDCAVRCYCQEIIMQRENNITIFLYLICEGEIEVVGCVVISIVGSILVGDCNRAFFETRLAKRSSKEMLLP